MRPRKVCVLGGSGFVGTHLCTALADAGYRVTVPTRDPERARHLRVVPALHAVRCNVHDLEQLAAVVAGQDVVVNLVGIINEHGRHGAGFRHAHAELTHKLIMACRRSGVYRLLHMSALGASADHGASHYLRSKGEAERIIRDEGGSDLCWTIFQPSIIFGSGDHFTTRFARLLRALPLGLPLARPRARLSPVWVDDVVAAMRVALEDEDTAGESYQLCGPEVFTLREIVTGIRDELGLRRAVVGLPDWLSRLQGALMDFVPGKPFSTDNYRSLSVDSVCTSSGFARLGLRPGTLGNVVPRYLGVEGGHSRFAALRRRARR